MCVYTGHVQELDLHRYDCASKYLSVSGGTYVLVKKQPRTSPGGGLRDNDDIEGGGAGAEGYGGSTKYDYVPLLSEGHLQQLAGYRLQRAPAAGGPAGDVARRRAVMQDDSRRKSSQTAAAGATKPGAGGSRSKPAKDRSPSKKTPRAN